MGGGDEARGAIGKFGYAGEGGGFPIRRGGEEGQKGRLMGFCVEKGGGAIAVRNLNEGIFLADTIRSGEGVGGVESPIAIDDQFVALGSWGKREEEGPEIFFLAGKGMGGWIPAVEGAGDADRFF
jgi:hypothetical protein